MTENQDSLASNFDLVVVEDSLGSRRLLSKVLTKEGYRVHAFEDGIQGLDAIRSDRPDLVLLDIMLPGMDGFEVCRQLKSDDATRQIPVIFISALDETPSVLQGFELGAADYITKPFQPAEVLARVKTQFRLLVLQRRLEAANQQLADQVKELAQAKGDLETRNQELQEALSTIKTLSGIVPICAWCHEKIRDEETGEWVQLENYLEAHSEAEFTHGICPACVKKMNVNV